MSLGGSCFDLMRWSIRAMASRGGNHGVSRSVGSEGGYELIVSHMCTVGTVALMRIKFKPNRKIMCHTFFAP